MNVTIYCKGAPVLSSDGKSITKSCTDRIHNTIKDRGLPVFQGENVVGSAVRFEKVTVAGVAMLRYEAHVIAEVDVASLQQVAEGYAGSISGAMWLQGLYPQKIQLTSFK
jgi:hypothetical protein